MLTTYQTLVREFRKHANEPQFIYGVTWHRIVLDEGEFAEGSYPRAILIMDLAHDIRDHHRLTAKAMHHLQAVSRWAVTGTPIQNSLSDIASLYQFLRIEPYTEDPNIFREHIKSLCDQRSDGAVSKARRLIRCIMLRRSIRIVELPERKELVYRLDFSSEEAKFYNQAMARTGSLFKDAVDDPGGDVSPIHILPWINSLRMICNLGTRAKLPQTQTQPTDDTWSISAAQDMFNTLVTTGAAICNLCFTDLGAVATEVADHDSNAPIQSRLSSCLYLICGPCFDKQRNDPHRCKHAPAHIMQPVSTLSSSLSIKNDRVTRSASMPTKVKALLEDLDEYVKDEKW